MKKVTDLKENEVIHCKTEEEAKAICKLMHYAGLNWCTGDSYLESDNCWTVHNSQTCYKPSKGTYGDFYSYKSLGCTIYPASDFLEFQLPEKWYIRPTKETNQILIDWGGGGYISDMKDAVLLHHKIWVNINDIKKHHEDCTEITFEQFKKHVLEMESEPIESKRSRNIEEIDYYELIKPEMKAVCEIIMDHNFPKNNLYVRLPICLERLEAADVLHLWFKPVYKEEKPLTPKLRDDINFLRDLCYNASLKAGWHTNIETGEPLKRNEGEMLMLIVTEISEAMEGIRKNLMDDKLPHRQMGEVEMADAVIRIMDFCGMKGYDIGGAIQEKMEFNKNRPDHRIENRLKENGKKV